MAGRPPKESIDYAGWDVNIFDNDPKIDKLLDAQGCVGFTIYFYLCQRAYGSYGYYYPWCFDDSATTARKIGGGASASSVEETVKLCFRVGLLDGELYDRWKILTSRGIQKRYMTVAITRTNKSVISEYWLLSDKESVGLVKAAISKPEMRIMTPDNSIIPPHNSHFSGSKVKDSKGEDSKGTPLAPQGGKKKKREKTDKERLREVWDSFSFSPAIEKALSSWIVYKKERRNNYKPQGFRSLLSQAMKHTETYGEIAVVNVIEESMANNWQGIAWSRLEQISPSQAKGGAAYERTGTTGGHCGRNDPATTGFNPEGMAGFRSALDRYDDDGNKIEPR